MKIFRSIKSIQKYLKQYQNSKIGLVPTMGTLHDGHIDLIKRAKKNCDLVIVSIFVNKKQFDRDCDYLTYPKNQSKDIKNIKNIADILFCPNIAEIYPNDFAATISVANLSNYLCGKARPNHFDAVALIVTKLFNIIKPNQAFFGKKDFQQLQIIKKLVSDLNIDVRIISCKTIRHKNGLAMSSRNLLLDNLGQKIAPKIYQNLCLAKEQISSGLKIDSVLKQVAENFIKSGFNKIDYLQVCDEKTLQTVISFNPKIKARLFIAIYIGNIRLIDNVQLKLSNTVLTNTQLNS
jgi:pantoate--beta-alanine ligase